MFGLGLPELVIVLLVIGIPVGLIVLAESLNKRNRLSRASDVQKMPFPEEYFFAKDATRLTKILKTMLWIVVVGLACDFFQYGIFNPGVLSPLTEDDVVANTFLQLSSAILSGTAFIITGVVFLTWIHRASSNSYAFGARNMAFSPGWSVGFYFIPILNLLRPYQSMKEIWKVSRNPADWENEPESALLRLWWILWIASIVLGQIAYYMAKNANSLAALREPTIVSIISGITEIPLCIVSVRLVSSIFAQQKRLIGMKAHPGMAPSGSLEA